MKVFGLTGGIGMGKSTAERLLRHREVPVIDTDALARVVVESGSPALEEIRRAFGDRVFRPDNQLHREELAKIVFSDSAARRTLETITHPRIRELWQKQVASWRSEGKRLAVVVIPLLFETGAETDLDAVICVACSAESQRARLRERGWTDAEIDQRISAQWSIEKKIEQADYVVWSEGEIDVLGEQLERVIGDAEAG